MQKSIISAVAVHSIITLMAGAAFAQKTTVDPNASGVVKPVDQPDTRLEQKVTYQASRRPVRVILEELSKQTGVPLRSGINEKDWQVRDRRMNVFAKDVPLKDLMDSIGRVMKFQWAVGGKGDQSSYRLFMDRKTELGAESARLREEARREKEMLAKREKTLKEFSRADELSQADMEKLKKESPFEYLAVSSGIASGMAAFFKGAPGAMEALASGTQLAMSAGGLSQAAQDGLLNAWKANVKLSNSLGIRGQSLPEDIAGNMRSVTVHLNRNLDNIRSTPFGTFILGEISVSYDGRSVELPLMDPDSKIAHVLGKAAIKSQEEGRSIEEVLTQMPSEVSMAYMAELKQEATGEPVEEHADDPALAEKINLEPKGGRSDQIMQALHEASTYAVVSDHFGSRMNMQNLDIKSETTIKGVLSVLTEICRYNWWKHGNVIELRDREWYRKRASQIPDAWMDEWRTTFKETGTLDIDDLAEMASLTPEQVNANIGEDEDFLRSSIHSSIDEYRELLRFYACLTKTQKALALSSSGLKLSGLNPEQWAKAVALIKRNNAGLLTNPEAKLVFTVTRTKRGTLLEYQFKLTTSDDLPALEFGLTTPFYIEPPKTAETKASETAPAK